MEFPCSLYIPSHSPFHLCSSFRIIHIVSSICFYSSKCGVVRRLWLLFSLLPLFLIWFDFNFALLPLHTPQRLRSLAGDATPVPRSSPIQDILSNSLNIQFCVCYSSVSQFAGWRSSPLPILLLHPRWSVQAEDGRHQAGNRRREKERKRSHGV